MASAGSMDAGCRPSLSWPTVARRVSVLAICYIYYLYIGVSAWVVFWAGDLKADLQYLSGSVL